MSLHPHLSAKKTEGATVLRYRRTCAWPGGCTSKPADRGKGGLCQEHSRFRHKQELATAYLEFAEELEGRAILAADHGVVEALWPAPPGAKELRRLARGCRYLAAHPDQDLPISRHQREVGLSVEELDWARSRQLVEEGLLELWPGRPSTHAHGVNQEEWTKLATALRILSESERKVFFYIKARELSHRQTAELLGISPGNVYNLLTRAERKLAEWHAGHRSAPEPDTAAVEEIRLYVVEGPPDVKQRAEARVHHQVDRRLVDIIQAAMEAAAAYLAG